MRSQAPAPAPPLLVARPFSRAGVTRGTAPAILPSASNSLPSFFSFFASVAVGSAPSGRPHTPSTSRAKQGPPPKRKRAPHTPPSDDPSPEWKNIQLDLAHFPPNNNFLSTFRRAAENARKPGGIWAFRYTDRDKAFAIMKLKAQCMCLARLLSCMLLMLARSSKGLQIGRRHQRSWRATASHRPAGARE